MSDPVYDWYERKRKEAERLVEELRKARESGASLDEIHRLKRELEKAREVGD